MKGRESAPFWLALGILGIVAVLDYRNLDAAANTLDWVEHTHQVLQQLDELSGSYARAASARRAYVVAGDPSQLGEVENLDTRVATSVTALRGLLADNPGQRGRLDLLARLLDERFSTLDLAIEHRRESGVSVETAEGLAQGARIRVVREEMEAEENKLLGERDARTRREVRQTKIAEIVGTCGSFVILLFAFHRLRQEIGRRRKSEEALRHANGFLDSIVENIPNMIFVKEAKELRFERFNRAGEELLGVPREELIGKNDFDFFPKEQAEHFQALDRETLAANVVVDVSEETIKTKNGERWLHTKKVPILDAKGIPRYLLGISEDITDRKHVAEVLKAAKDEAVAANHELEAFSYSVAHDLRAPLRSIDGFSLALEEDCGATLAPASREHLQRVRASAQHMGRLIDGLLGLSRVTRCDFFREPVDLTELARGSATRLHESYPERQIDLVIQDGLVADGDARLLAAAFDNLLGNAWKFTGKRDDARIEVGQKIENGRPVFFVRDNGAGFDAAYVHKLFGAFQRLHPAAEFEGSGIGLATVQRIVQRHGGHVRAEGEVGRGATIYFGL